MKARSLKRLVASVVAIAALSTPSFACINGAMKCETHMVYVCQAGWWVITQGVCHSDDTSASQAISSLKLSKSTAQMTPVSPDKASH